MSQIPALISDLAVILISAGLVTLLFKKLKQPVVLGYIVAGILAGPSIEQIPTVTDVESIRIWADIGVIFLLFALGLDFSFKKLMKVGGTAVIGAITVVIGMMTAGYITGLSLGWGHMNSLSSEVCYRCLPRRLSSRHSTTWDCVTNDSPVSYSVSWWWRIYSPYY